MQVLKADAQYNSLLFIAWLMHLEANFPQRDVFLERSRQYNSEVTEQDWSNSFVQFAKEFGVEFDPACLSVLV